MTQSLSPAIRRTIRNTLGDALQRAVRRSPNKEALVFGERRWTYQALNQAVNRVAHALLDRGLQPGDRVVAGEGPEITTREEWAALLPSDYDVTTVTWVEQKYWHGQPCHVEAGA